MEKATGYELLNPAGKTNMLTSPCQLYASIYASSIILRQVLLLPHERDRKDVVTKQKVLMHLVTRYFFSVGSRIPVLQVISQSDAPIRASPRSEVVARPRPK